MNALRLVIFSRGGVTRSNCGRYCYPQAGTKRDAMVAWSESMTAAVKRAGGTLPAPMETARAKRSLHFINAAMLR